MIRPSLRLAALAAGLALAACSEEAPAPLDLNGPPAALAPLSGDGQDGTVGATLAPLVVRVTDGNGRVVPAAEVRWETAAGSVTPAVDTTDDDGASAARWTLPDEAGEYTARAVIDGMGTVTFRATALPSSERLVFRYVDAGSYHACGITTSEELYCWGYNGDGQLGVAVGAPRLLPTLVEGSTRYRAVSGGRYHTCGVELSGRVPDCWGEDYDGRTRAGDPVTYQAVSAGLVHTCALSIARQVFCWGYAREGQLGTLAQDGFVGEAFRAVTAGGQHTCAIREGGAGACWGFNAEGQLGVGSGTRVIATPTPVAGGITFNTEPLLVPIPPDPSFPLPDGPWIAAGYAHSCGIAADGATWCWGNNEMGQLGSGDRTGSNAPRAVAGGRQFVRITTGYRHSCGLTSGGVAYCWGSNATGQLGDGTTTDRLVPTAVAGGLAFSYLKAGDLSTCGVTTTGVAYCWGDNEYGQLGTGTTGSSTVPVKVAFQP